MPNTTQTYFLYCRKSSEDDGRQVLSIDSQIGTLTHLANSQGIEIAKTFTESKSAKAPGRDKFNEMLVRIEKGEANGILCWKLDRLARNPVDEGRIKWMLQKGVIRNIKTPDRDYLPGDNVLITSVEFGMANQYLIDLSKNVKRGLATKAQMGWFSGYAPLGYLNTKTREKGANAIVKDPERFHLVRQLFDLMLTGNYSIAQLLKLSKKWGLRTRPAKTGAGKTMSRSNLYKLFQNPFYYGVFEYPRESGNWYQGKHDAMISKQEFDKVQEHITRKDAPRYKKHEFEFTGMIRCGSCNSMVTAEQRTKTQQNGNVHHYLYYHCAKRSKTPCHEKSIEEKELWKQVDFALSKLEISEQFKDWAIRYLHEYRSGEAKASEEIFDSKTRELAFVIKQLDSLVLKYTAPENEMGELISADEYKKLKGNLMKQKIDLDQELANQASEKDRWLELTERTFNFAKYARYHFKNGDRAKRRDIFAALGSYLYLSDQKINIELHYPFQTIMQNKEQIERELLQVRTLQNTENKMLFMQIIENCPTLRRREDSNLRGDFSPNILAGCSFQPLKHASEIP